MQASGHALQVQIFYTYRIISFCKPPAEFMLEIFSLVLYLFMAQRYSLLLFLIIPASFFTVGEFPLFPYKFFLCFPVKHRIPGSFPCGKYTHSPHGKIDPKEFFCRTFFHCLALTAEQKTCKIFSGWLTAHSYRLQFPV